ncbi:HAD-IA family hydrolase [Candidatus Woesearchaeota archaeon]|nr:HAD-IA family hydrolase [Candidatus Woesearchaeota archaeon]
MNKRVEEKWNIPKEQFLLALTEIMDIVRKPGAPPSFSLWQPYFKQWKLNISEQEFFTFWFSGEKMNTEVIRLSRELHRKGIKVFILSNNFKERTQFYRENFPELFTSIDKAYFSWETGFVKPDERAWLNILEENRLTPKECFYVDDSHKNVLVAKGLGIDAYLFEGLNNLKKTIWENREI